MASIKGGLPQFHIPMVPLNFETLEIILPYAVILAAIGLIESLLTLNLVAETTQTKGGASKECVAQGVSNVVTGFFGGMGGCAMIGQSMINVKSGGRTRWSGISAALFLLVFILFASALIEMIPLAALVGVMFMVVIGTFAWRSIQIMTRIPLTDAFVIVLVTIVTVATNLAIAVVVGVIVSALAYAWNASTRMHATSPNYKKGDKEKVYQLEGPLFFGSIESFNALFDPQNDPETVIIDFAGSRVVDHSGLQAIEALAAKYEAHGTTLKLRHLSRDCKALMAKAGQLVEPAEDDPQYGVATDYDLQTGRLDAGH
jgi:SulP family sulfate permease